MADQWPPTPGEEPADPAGAPDADRAADPSPSDAAPDPWAPGPAPAADPSPSDAAPDPWAPGPAPATDPPPSDAAPDPWAPASAPVVDPPSPDAAAAASSSSGPTEDTDPWAPQPAAQPGGPPQPPSGPPPSGPPPPGWQPGTGPSPYGPGGYGPGPFGPGGVPSQPSSRVALVLGILAGVVLLGGAIVAAVLFVRGSGEIVTLPAPTVVAPRPEPARPVPAPPVAPPGTETLTVGDSATGTIRSGRPDTYALRAGAGQQVLIAMAAVDPALDPVLQLSGPDGAPIGQDDDSGSGLNALLETTVGPAGTYRLEASGFGPSAGAYVLRVLDGGTLSRTPVLEVQDVLSTDRPVRTYSLDVPAGAYLRITMTAQDQGVDPFLALSGVEGELARDDDSGGNLDARIAIVVSTAGPVTIEASAFGDNAGPFLLQAFVD